MTSILLTGGAGYIGCHTYLALHAAGFTPVVLDDFSNANPVVLRRLEALSGKPVICVRGDVGNARLLDGVFTQYQPTAAIHFAASKSVGESVREPLKYYHNNTSGLITFLAAMQQHNCKRIVFSSSATVYGDCPMQPIPESAPLSHTNPYGHTKLMGEQILQSLRVADPNLQVAALRYFNPVGAHESGLIGEDPSGIPNNLMPYVAQVAAGMRDKLTIFGNDYPTPDGTGVRDYIHVSDLADAHVCALRYLLDNANTSITANIGTGVGVSVLELVKAYELACGKPIPHVFAPRRAGDVATCYADATKARDTLGWSAKRNLADMCASSWRWQGSNPNGYKTVKGN